MSQVALGLGFLLGGSAAWAQTNFQRVFSLDVPDHGSSPQGPLVQAADTYLYGTTAAGGANRCGTVFRILPDGTSYSVVHSFASPMVGPISGVIIGPENLLYGTVPVGGRSNVGAIFRVGRDGANFTVLHEFGGTPADGNSPLATLLLANDGFLYGTTAGGGSSNEGTLFRIRPSGTQYELLRHCSLATGSMPSAGLIMGQDGLLYGTARHGGTAGGGVVFKMALDGSGYTIVRNFIDSGLEAREPVTTLVQDTNGVLYGTTFMGGNYGAGTVFKLNTNGTGYAVLYHAKFDTAYGAQPVSALMLSTNGYLYGTALRGGAYNGGLAFKLKTDGSEFSIVHDFTGNDGDGLQPYSPLLQADNGMFYGTTYMGGDNQQSGALGIIYRLSEQPFPGRLFATKQGARIDLLFKDGNGATLYDIQRTIELGSTASWEVIGTTNTLSSGTFSFSDAPSSGSAFYRAVKH